MKKTENNSSLGTWIFVLLSCAFVVAIGYKAKNASALTIQDETVTNVNNNIDDETWEGLFEEVVEEVNENDVAEDENIEINKEEIDNIFIADDITEQKDNESEVYVNKIIISKNIDYDKSSDTYRNPIDAFKTISTLNQSVVKEVDYYPTLFVWTSVNTENVSLVNEDGEIEPVNLSMTLKCKNKLIDKLDYTITAKTPRWREWIEINLENVDEDVLNEFWNVEIVDNKNNTVLESRNFKLLDSNTILEQVSLNKLDFESEEKNHTEKGEELWDEQPEGIDLFNLNGR